MSVEFKPFKKIARWSREIVITEKIDGTNAIIYIGEDGTFLTGSRNRWITPEDDNYGFSKWAHENKKDLMKLGAGTHYGEWWGHKIQSGYGLSERRFSLFNVSRWNDTNKPLCCHVVPVIAKIILNDINVINNAMELLKNEGSLAAPGFMKPEGIIIYHERSNTLFKKTFHKDAEGKDQ